LKTVTTGNDIITFLNAHKDELAERFGVVSLGLFDSYARGEARDDSDIDIAIELTPNRKTLSNFLGIRRYLEQQLGKPVDLGIESTLKPLARETIAKEIHSCLSARFFSIARISLIREPVIVYSLMKPQGGSHEAV
jgi:hypothetical protein